MEGLISEDEALRNADSPNNVRLKIKFAQEEDDDPDPGSRRLSVEGTDDEMVLPDEDSDDAELVLEPSPLDAELVLEDSPPPGEANTQRPAPPPPVFETSPAYGAAKPQQDVAQAPDNAGAAPRRRGEYGGLSIEMDDDPGRLF
jgi:twitching motility protein PilU